ncbi:hypothetical protein MRB53_022330 [Persea americana]|uniref:Uncharacterized protein n=1 Tax=Persea americana TaxID=3435 RepID=A0ACC2L6A8_PERAE|nr:hypothetical protein MRB53_022330 [Persea americana]
MKASPKGEHIPQRPKKAPKTAPRRALRNKPTQTTWAEQGFFTNKAQWNSAPDKTEKLLEGRRRRQSLKMPAPTTTRKTRRHLQQHFTKELKPTSTNPKRTRKETEPTQKLDYPNCLSLPEVGHSWMAFNRHCKSQ